MTQPAPPADLDELKQAVRRFVVEREWDKFHSPKNLSMALLVEAAELAEHFQWLTEAESAALAADRRAEVELEMADVLIYLISLSHALGTDLVEAAGRKLAINARKYPAEQVRGSARKYTDYGGKGAR